MRPRNFSLIVAVVLLVAACGSPEQRAADYMKKAQALYDSGDYLKAKLEAQNAAQVEPKNPKVRYLLAEIAEQQKEYAQMFSHLLVAVDEDPGNVEARLKLGTLYFLGQSWDDAGKQATELLKLAPTDTRVHLLQGRLLIQKGDRTGGMAEVAKALEIDPDNVDAILLQSAADALESLDKALATLDTAIDRLPQENTRQLRELRLIMLSQAKRTDEVEAGLRALAKDFPEEQGYQFQLAQLYSSQGRVDEADRMLKELTELDPTNADKQLGYVQFLATQRDSGKAEAALKTFIEKNPDAGALRLALGQLYEGDKKPDEARKAYEALAQRAPKSPDGLAARGRIAAIELRAGKMDEGRARIDSILKDAPDDATALLLRSGLRFTESKFDDAIGDLRLVLRKEPNNERALLLMAQAYVQKGDLALAKDSYRRLLEVVPDSPDGLQQLAALYVADKDYGEAEALVRKRLAKQPDDLIASGRLVEILMVQGQTAKAEAEARRMQGLANQTGVGDFSLGRVLAQKKDYGAAAEAFRKSVDARNGDPLPLEGLVRSLMAEGKKSEAISVLNQQLNGKNQLFAKFLLGSIYGQDGDQAKAEGYLEDVLKEKPDSVVAWTALAGIYKEPDQRIRVLQRAVKAVPANPELSMLLAGELEHVGRYDDAIPVYEALLKANPKYTPAMNNLAALLLDQRTDPASHARALKLAQPLATSENPALLDTLGWAQYKAGNYADAVGVLERVVAKAGAFPVFHYHLGMAYLKAGNPVGARQQLLEAVKVDKPGSEYPGLAEARATLEKLNKPS